MTSRVYGGGSSSYVSKLSSERLTVKGLSSSYQATLSVKLSATASEGIFTSGTFSLSVCEEAASVVTARRQALLKVLGLKASGPPNLKTLENIVGMDNCGG